MGANRDVVAAAADANHESPALRRSIPASGQCEGDMMKKMLLVAALLLLSVPTQAKTALSTVQISLPGVSGCSIVSGATTNINFAAVVAGTPIPVQTATGSISYQCSNVPTSLSLSDGGNAYALTTAVAGGAPVPFTLSGVNNENDNLGLFRDEAGGGVSLGAHAKATDTITLTATLAPTVGETVVVGMYADTVTATLSFT